MISSVLYRLFMPFVIPDFYSITLYRIESETVNTPLIHELRRATIKRSTVYRYFV